VLVLGVRARGRGSRLAVRGNEHDYEYRCAEYEHDYEHEHEHDYEHDYEHEHE
jgi:hypothetical protein